MRRLSKGYTLTELLTVTAVILVLTAIAVSFSAGLKRRLEISHTENLIARISDAIEQYHSVRGEYPFVTYEEQNDPDFPVDTLSFDQLRELIEIEITGDTTVDGSNITVSLPAVPASAQHTDFITSEALYFKLSRCNEAAKYLDRLPEKMLTAKVTGSNEPIYAEYGTDKYILTRMVDYWGNPITYLYRVDWTFPRIVSNGPDGLLDTEDDISNY